MQAEDHLHPAGHALLHKPCVRRLAGGRGDRRSHRVDACFDVVRRVADRGALGFARGLSVTLECDEGAFEGSSMFLLGAVLDRFFAKYVSINSFTETVLRSTRRGEVMRWPHRLGLRTSL